MRYADKAREFIGFARAVIRWQLCDSLDCASPAPSANVDGGVAQSLRPPLTRRFKMRFARWLNIPGPAMPYFAVSAMILGLSGIAKADNDCSLPTLRGSYVFAAKGYNIVSGVPQPKAIIEVIVFNGDGTLTVPAVSRSINGVISRAAPGAPGTYTVDASCTGTISFSSGQEFDIFIAPKGDTIWMIQATQDTVFQGTATKQ
jgi:hypothetical protein